jgi:hypothetical protein
MPDDAASRDHAPPAARVFGQQAFRTVENCFASATSITYCVDAL